MDKILSDMAQQINFSKGVFIKNVNVSSLVIVKMRVRFLIQSERLNRSAGLRMLGTICFPFSNLSRYL
jgi:hypothetical protein